LPTVSDPDQAPEQEQLLALTTRREGEATVVTATGEVDLVTAGRLQDATAAALAEPTAVVVVDLTHVTFLGSSGLSALVAAARAAAARREPLRVVVDHTRPVVRPIEASGLDGLLSLYTDVEDALIGPEAERRG
jgi:anti-sigma B factor antagonist